MQDSMVQGRIASAGLAFASGAASLATDQWALAIFGVKSATLLAAFAGAVLMLSFLPPEPGRRWAPRVVTATLLAAYAKPVVHPWLVEKFHISEDARLAIAALLAMLIQALLTREMRSIIWAVVRSWLLRFKAPGDRGTG